MNLNLKYYYQDIRKQRIVADILAPPAMPSPPLPPAIALTEPCSAIGDQHQAEVYQQMHHDPNFQISLIMHQRPPHARLRIRSTGLGRASELG